MPGGLVLVKDGAERFFYEEDVQRARAEGWAPRGGEQAQVRDRVGDPATVASEAAPEYLRQVGGSTLAGPLSTDVAAGARIDEDIYGGVAGGAGAFSAGAARGLTLGLSDAALTALGVSPRELAALRRIQPGASIAGEVVGVTAPAIFSGGAGLVGRALSATPAGLAARAGAGLAGLGEGGGLAARALATGAGGAAEGVAQGAGQALSDAILEDKPLTAEAFVASVGSNALYGAAFGVGAEAAIAGGRAVASGARKLAGKGQTAAESVGRRVDAILTPGSRTAATTELDELRRVGDSAADQARQIVASPATPVAQKAILGDRIEEVEAAAKQMDAAGGMDAVSAQTAAEPALTPDEVPAGFSIEAGGFFDRKTTVKAGVPSYDELKGVPRTNPHTGRTTYSEPHRDVAYVVRPSELATRDIRGFDLSGDVDAEHFASIEKAWAEGKSVPALQVDVLKDGSMLLEDGNHRLLAAARTDRPVLVQFRSSAGRETSAKPIGDTIQAALPSRAAGPVSAAAPPSDSVTAYHEAVKGLADDLGKAGRPVEVPANPVARLETPEGAVASVEELVPDVGHAQRAALRGEMSASVEALDQTASPILDEARELLAVQAPVEQIGGQSMAEILGHVDNATSLAGLVQRAENAQAAMREAFGLDQAAADEALDKLLHAPPAELGQALRRLQAYDDASRKLAEAVDAASPSITGVPRVAQLDQVRVPRKAGAPPPPPPTGWDAGDALALADLAGLDIEDIPILGQLPGIGAILKARLAYRRLRAGAAKVRMAGGAGKVGSIAVRARVLRDGVGKAVDGFLASKKPIGHLAVPSALAALHGVSYGSGDVPAKETEQQAFRRVAEELTTANQSKAALAKGLAERLDLEVPELVDPILEAAKRKVEYLAGMIPKDPREPSILRDPWAPSGIELHEFAERVAAAENPLGALRQLALGQMTPAAAETIREVYPALFTSLQRQFVEELAARQADISQSQQSQLSILLDLPVSASEEPAFVAAMQEGYQAKKDSAPAPGGAPKPRLGALGKLETIPTAADRTAFQ